MTKLKNCGLKKGVVIKILFEHSHDFFYHCFISAPSLVVNMINIFKIIYDKDTAFEVTILKSSQAFELFKLIGTSNSPKKHSLKFH